MNKLDLHGIKHEDVFRTVDNFIGKHVIGNAREIFIITGNSEKMKQIVRDIAQDYKANVEDVWGNSGALRISF